MPDTAPTSAPRPINPSSGGDVCVICMCNYEPGDTLLHLPCAHAFHDACGSKWLGYSKKCPVCKREVQAAVAAVAAAAGGVGAPGS